MFKILSIVSPQGDWTANFKQEDGSIEKDLVIVWAVVEGLDGHRLTSFSQSGDETFLLPDDNAENFVGWEKVNDQQTPPS